MSITLDPEQHRVIREATAEAQNFGATPREKKALVEALFVESNARNLSSGDRDSRGALQQRPSQGWMHSQNVKLATRDFLTAARRNRGIQGSAGTLAQSVQRSAYPSRYDEKASVANQLLGQSGGGSSGVSLSNPTLASNNIQRTVKETVADPAAQKRVALANFLGKTDPGSMLLRLGVVDPSEATTKVVTRSLTTGRSSNPLMVGQTNNNDQGTNNVIDRLVNRANSINSKQLPYLYGGGHAGKVNPKTTGPLDCSGAVSAVLGVNPRVASQFMKWGNAGQGKRVTIYAKGDHTLMEIDGHFFGTSHSNPGGGAGWIKHQDVSKAYLSQFVARHPQGM